MSRLSLAASLRVALVKRDGDVFAVTPSLVLQAGDRLTVTGDPKELAELRQRTAAAASGGAAGLSHPAPGTVSG